MLARTIWALWWQGWAAAPDLVRACAASWRQHNPGWDIHYLSHETLKPCLRALPELQDIIEKGLPLDALSDVVRIELLNRHGGLWVDSTVYCLRPLDGWIHEAMPRGFFAFDRPAPDRMLSSWFLAAEPESHVVQTWRRMAFAYWNERAQRDDYFWFHRLFSQAYQTDARFRAMWDATPKISADAPHCFIPYEERLFAAVDEPTRRLVDEARTPVLKLTHKVPHENGGPGTTYRWLCERVGSAFDFETPAATSLATGAPYAQTISSG